MKTFTFKIKLHYPSNDYPAILSVVHCPLEVLFDSLKEVKQITDLYETVKNPSNKEVPSMYITASDYLNSNGQYINEDFLFCDYKAIIDSNSLTELLLHRDYYGLVEDISMLEKKPAKKPAKKNTKKVVKKDEV